jgi:hypothetical protein
MMNFLNPIAVVLGIVDWVKNQIALIGVAALVAVLAGGVGYAKGVWDAAERCQIAGLQSRVKTLEADQRASQRAEIAAQRIAREIEGRAAFLEQKVTDYEAQLAKRPAAQRCLLDGADVRSLRNIR